VIVLGQQDASEFIHVVASAQSLPCPDFPSDTSGVIT